MDALYVDSSVCTTINRFIRCNAYVYFMKILRKERSIGKDNKSSYDKLNF